MKKTNLFMRTLAALLCVGLLFSLPMNSVKAKADEVIPTFSLAIIATPYTGSDHSITIMPDTFTYSDIKYNGSTTLPKDVGTYKVTFSYASSDSSVTGTIDEGNALSYEITAVPKSEIPISMVGPITSFSTTYVDNFSITPSDLSEIYINDDFNTNVYSNYTVTYGLTSGNYTLNTLSGQSITQIGTYTYYYQISDNSNTYDPVTGTITYIIADPNASTPTPAPSPTAPAEDTDNDDNSSTANEATAPEEPIVVVPKNVINVDGSAPVISTVSGIYETAKVAGTAVTTPADQIKDSVGTAAEGNNVAMFVCDAAKKDYKDHLASSLANTSGKLLNYLTMDMYTISPVGEVVNIRETAKTMTVVIQLNPDAAIAERNYSVSFVLPNGRVVTFADTDNNPNTITINTTAFGVCAITYTTN